MIAEQMKKGIVAAMYKLNSCKFILLARKNHSAEIPVVIRESINTSFTLRCENSFIVWINLD
jgi:hypothetical protein